MSKQSSRSRDTYRNDNYVSEKSTKKRRRQEDFPGLAKTNSASDESASTPARTRQTQRPNISPFPNAGPTRSMKWKVTRQITPTYSAAEPKRSVEKEQSQDESDLSEVESICSSANQELELLEVFKMKENPLSASKVSSTPSDQVDEVMELAGEVIRYILFKNSARIDCTTMDIRQTVLNKVKCSNAKFTWIMTYAYEGFKDLLGYELFPDCCLVRVNPVAETGEEIVKRMDKEAKHQTFEGKTTKNESTYHLYETKWYLRKLPRFVVETANTAPAPAESRFRAVLMSALALILLKECRITEQELLTKLLELQYKVPLDLGKLVKQFMSQGYIKRRKNGRNPRTDEPLWAIEFGSRFYAEVGIPNIVAFIEQTVGSTMSKPFLIKIAKLKA